MTDRIGHTGSLLPNQRHLFDISDAEANIYVSLRGSSIRIAPHLHTTEADVNRLLNVLAEALHAG